MLGRMQSLLGPFPQTMLDAGRDTVKYFTAKGQVFEKNLSNEVVTDVTWV
jgi:hypothetical protein